MTEHQLVFRAHELAAANHTRASELTEREAWKMWRDSGVQMSRSAFDARVGEYVRAMERGQHRDWLATGPVVRGGMG